MEYSDRMVWFLKIIPFSDDNNFILEFFSLSMSLHGLESVLWNEVQQYLVYSADGVLVNLVSEIGSLG
jgi:hypothetical protein